MVGNSNRDSAFSPIHCKRRVCERQRHRPRALRSLPTVGDGNAGTGREERNERDLGKDADGCCAQATAGGMPTPLKSTLFSRHLSWERERRRAREREPHPVPTTHGSACGRRRCCSRCSSPTQVVRRSLCMPGCPWMCCRRLECSPHVEGGCSYLTSCVLSSCARGDYTGGCSVQGCQPHFLLVCVWWVLCQPLLLFFPIPRFL